ncbi:MAG: patatin-like phospholipase family protein [Planctomycetes bacterium]|nr:patatin-like phospholipase family protein [Planctomycetota bacterium]
MNLAALLLCLQAAAQAGPHRPRVGLVLSGGGARGAAHVGVLRVLEELHVPVDFVTGTSMGAIVGGLYSAGLSPDEIERILTETDWLTLFDDDPPREHMSWRRKLDDRGYLVDLEIGLSAEGIELPRGLIQGQKLNPLFRDLTLRGLVDEDFDKLRLPFRAVAMDVVDGDTVVLARGDLAQAMRASMSIAGAFAPVEVDGRLLVDGGYVDNLPVDVAETLGAEVVIAVDVGTPPVDDRGKLRSLFAISSQVQDLVVAASRRASRARLDADDVLVVPELGDLSFTAFDESKRAIAIGRAAAEARADALAKLAVDAGAWSAFLARQRAPAPPPRVVRAVRIENRSRLSTATLEELVGVRAGDVLDSSAVHADLQRLSGLGYFESVDFEVKRGDDGVELVYSVREKEWGPNYLRFGLSLNEDFSGRSDYGLGLGLTVAPVGELGAEWRTELHIGSTLGVASEYYQPLDHALRWFVAPRVSILRRTNELDEHASVGDFEYRVDERAVGLDLGRNLGDWGEARVGLQRSKGDLDAETSVPQPEEGEFTDVAWTAGLRWDKLDERDFPHHGVVGGLQAWLAREELGSDDDHDRALLTTAAYSTWGDFTGTAALELGTSFGTDLPLQRQFLLGGFGRLSGRAPNSIAGDELGLARVGGYYGLGGAFVPTYAGFALELGQAWDRRAAVTLASLEPSAALYFGADTPLGPLVLGAGVAEAGQSSFFLILGRGP